VCVRACSCVGAEEPELLRVLKRKSEVWASYMQHLYSYGLLKVEGEWFPQHRVASILNSTLYTIRIYYSDFYIVIVPGH
jgi:hypothetical protein